MNDSEIRADIEATDGEAALRDELAFARRSGAIDRLELHVLDRIDILLSGGDDIGGLEELRAAAERVMDELEAVDERLFDRLRGEIRAGGCRGAALTERIREYAGEDSGDGIGYDTADEFINGLLTHHPLPEETVALEREMVPYHKTPVRIILQLADRLAADDVFYDVGAGLGQVPILVHLLRGVEARGSELEPAYCRYARRCAKDLHLPRVRFIHADARTADYADGTVFFLYTPFRGRILAQVLARLESESRTRPIRIFTYGPCTPVVAREPWLRRAGETCDDPYRLAVFESV